MKIISDINHQTLPPSVATIGFFDGVHRGHRFLINQVKEVAAKDGLYSALITFPVHPRQVIQTAYRPQLLSSPTEKLELLETMQVDYCFLLPFTQELSLFSAREFMQLLRNKFNIHTLVIGYDHRFGHNRSENFEDYCRYGEELNIYIVRARAYTDKEGKISSSVIRQLLKEGEVSIYVCGPTVYNYVHIGNTRPMIVFDVLRRTFEYLGNKVTFVSNFTDVDDKIIKAAKQEGITEKELTDKYIKAYEDVRRGLNLEFPTYAPRVTETMDQIISFIQKLVDKGYAYVVDGDVYFRVSKVKEYGELSGIKIEDLVAGASERVEDKGVKEETTDFALWKKTDEGIQFDSPWSKGRPGWHTECVVMINDIFENGRIDIHGGGQDLKFPHHENEIAQSRALNGHPIADTWMHNQMININNEKMSKSLGNVVWAKDLIVELGCNVYKWFMLSSHYRNPLNMTNEIIEGVKKEVAKVENVLKQTSLYVQVNHLDGDDFNKDTVDHMVDALADDLNTSLALTEILNQVKVLNQAMRVKEKDNTLILKEYNTLLKMTDVIGFVFKPKQLDEDELELYSKWLDAKVVKDFEKADQYRAELIQKGII